MPPYAKGGCVSKNPAYLCSRPDCGGTRVWGQFGPSLNKVTGKYRWVCDKCRQELPSKMTEEQKDRFYESWKRAREAKKRAQETQNQMMGKRKRDGPGDGA